MKRLSLAFALIFALVATTVAQAAPLRVFIRGGKKTHGPGAHEHEQFLKDWTKLLNGRGMQASGGMEFPTAEQLDKTDVLIMYAQDGGNIPADKRPGLEKFLKRGGGIVVIHTAAVATTPEGSAYLKSLIGGAWVQGTTKWLEGPMSLYYVNRTHPITKDVANYDMNDEIYYDMDLNPAINVLAAAYTPNTSNARKKDARGLPQKGKVTVYDIEPQIWTFENKLAGGQPYRAYVQIPGHRYENFSKPHFRAVLLRGITWAGNHSNVDEYCTKEELASLRYPEGGPSRPEKSRQEMVIHPDFNVSLVASEPLVNKVMNVDWDPQGRMWVVETPEYPDGRYANDTTDYVEKMFDAPVDPATGRYIRPAHDKVSILTDTDGDGVMDKKQIFYEGLELATSLVFYKDGVIVSQAPDILWLRDTNGDGKADKVEKLYTGLGTRDTHSVMNNLRWGYDGWIYTTHGYSTGDVTSPDGKKSFGKIGSGVVRFKPDGSMIEQYSSKGGNTWGLQISWDNEVFWTQPTSGDLLMHVVMSEDQLAKGRVSKLTSYNVVEKSIDTFPLIPYDRLPYVQIDWVGHFTAAAGCVIYGGGAWPAEWNYNYFCTEPTINIVHHEVVTPEGVSYTAHKLPGRETMEFIAGKDYWFRPIEVRTGPDGAVYLVDFYNQAVIHNDTRGPKHGPRNAAIRPDRDHYYSRIWRIDHKQAKTLKVPKLSQNDTAGLIDALRSPNDNVRMTAVRLLSETENPKLGGQLKPLVLSAKETPATRIGALWVMQRVGGLDEATLVAAANDPEVAVRKNAFKVAQLPPTSMRGPEVKLHALLIDHLFDPNPQARLEALIALNSFEVDDEVADALVKVFPGLDDKWSQSAAIGLASTAPRLVIERALTASDTEPLRGLVLPLASRLAEKQDGDESANLVIALAGKPASTDPLKEAVLDALTGTLKNNVRPIWSPVLQAAFTKYLTSKNEQLAIAALPLASRWDIGRKMDGTIIPLIDRLITSVKDNGHPEAARLSIAESLLAVRHLNEHILPGVAGVIGSDAPETLQKGILEAFGKLPGSKIGDILIHAYTQTTGMLQDTAFAQVLRRGDWALAFLNALKEKKVDNSLLTPAAIHRLRTHADARVSKLANTLMDQLRGPVAKEKATLIAKFTPEVQKPGNVAKGKEIFTANCATCHKLGDIGASVGPELTGMGAHGPAELLVHILDPNREVDFAFNAWSIDTKDGETYDGVIARENPTMVALRNAAGEMEIQKNNIKRRRNTGRSLMPEGFEALGAEGLRDLLSFVCAADQKYRFIDLTTAYTADSRRGLYIKEDNTKDTLKFKKYGIVKVEGVPFDIVDPARSGRNLIVLKGGGDKTFSHTMPQKVEAKVGFAASKLHFLGGVAGWGFPLGGGKIPVMKATVYYADGQKEELVMNNGEQFADYIRVVDVPGSKLTEGVVKENQLRWYTETLKHGGVIDKIVLESYNNGVAPTTVAITAELPSSGTQASAAPVQVASASALPVPAQPLKWGKGLKVLLVGGGTSHDFQKFFNEADSKMLTAAGMSVHYTEDPAVTARELAHVDVAVLSVNRGGFQTPEFRAALFKFVDQGKGLVLLHPGVWYNWKDWPEYNRVIAGGGSRGHDHLGEFDVTVKNTSHPITKGVPAKFTITDELYHFELDAAGTPIEILATATSKKDGKDYPQVFVVKHPKARIAAITLGHDARAHDLPAYQTLLKNAIKWTAGK